MTINRRWKRLNHIRSLTMAFLSLLMFAACAKNPDLNPDPQAPSNEGDLGSTNPTPTPPPASFKYEALAWESTSHPERKDWSTYVFQVVSEEYDRLNQVTDATVFCPKYANLSKNQRINFWGQLIAGMSFYEAGWSPVSRMQETTMGTDPVTGKAVYSEGLLQLSYQDIQWAPYCEFDWNKDKYLSATDPKKTILDPYKNLRCGIKILADQVARKKEIALSSGVYWAVLKEGGAYTKISQIAAYVQKLSFCK